MQPFAQLKFQSLPLMQQHNHCAITLRKAYEGENVLQHYSMLREWMGLSPWHSTELKSIADEYHNHLNQADRNLREHNLLPQIHRNDRKEPIAPPLPIAIYLDNLRSAHNVGSIIRTTEAFALGELYFSPRTPTPQNKQVQDTAMGAHEWIDYQIIETLSQLPHPIIALETSKDATPLNSFIFPDTFTLAIGNEEYGCSEATLTAADYIVTIPMLGRKNSLNVANAFAITAAEIRRQHDVRRSN